ncbi:MAG TPA: elongation factor P, partial [Thermaerobacter sp.]
MIQAGDFKNGMAVVIDGAVHQVLEFQHVKPGRGQAFVRAKIKNLET